MILPTACPRKLHIVNAKTCGSTIVDVHSPLTKEIANRAKLWPRGMRTAPWPSLHGDDSVFGIALECDLVGVMQLDDLSAQGALIHAIDVSPENRFGAPNRLYKYCGMALVCLAATLSLEAGGGGMVGAQSKTTSLGFYTNLGFRRGGGNKVFLYDHDARRLMDRYDGLRLL